MGSGTVMATKGTLVCFVTLLLCGLSCCGPPGREFALSYMQNYINANYEHSDHLIEVYNPPTAKASATVKVSALGKVEQKVVQPGQSEVFHFSNDIEMSETTRGQKTVLVESSEDVMVTAVNYKLSSSGTSVIYPVSDWGTEYYIFTPVSPPSKEPLPYAHQEFAITNHKHQKNTVEIRLRGMVNYQGKQYPKGSKLIIDMEPYESVLIQSNEDLTNTQVLSKHPVAVFTGHSCTWLFAGCDHVYEQLLPVNSWGKDFIVVPILYDDPKRYDSVYIQASETTKITLRGQDGTILPIELKEGESYRANLFGRSSLRITSDKGIQVLFEFNGGITQDKVMNDPFLMNVVPIDRYTTAYTIQGEKGFANKAILIVPNNKLSGLIVDKAQMPKSVQWYKTGSSEYSWTQLTFDDTSALHQIAHSDTPFVLYSFGVAKVNGYGTSAFAHQAVIPRCPPHSHFDFYASSCPVTCENPNPQSNCAKSPACICNEGYILSKNKCVKQSQCGCVYSVGTQKHNLELGQSVWADSKCSLKCTCNTNGKITCVSFGCLPWEECRSVKGLLGCFPKSYGSCSISGDPHYNTFDNKTYDFQGTCTYTAAEACHIKGTKLTPFMVVVENERWDGISQDVSMAKVVIVEVYDEILVLRRDQLRQITVNNALTSIPLSLLNGKVKVFQEGLHYAITTDFGLKVTYDMIYKVTITVPSTYRDKMCGLCGNYNGNPNDDYQLPDGKQTSDVNTFGAEWKVPVVGVICDDGCNGDFCPKCDPQKKVIYEKDCSIITDPKGPFAACHSVIKPESYYNDCVYDVCIGKGDRNVLCLSIRSYVTDCQNFGVKIQNWRTPHFCPLSCPANSHYETCAIICEKPCPGLTDIITCETDTCAEACTCNPGFFFNGTNCVNANQCGCYEDGTSYNIGETVVTDDCKEILTCLATGEVKHEALACKSNEVCQVRNGIRGCYPSQCVLEAGGIFTFYSGGIGKITTTGAYEIVRVCNGVLQFEWFRVVADVQICATGGIPITAAVYVFFDDLVITINSKQEIWFNGMKIYKHHYTLRDGVLMKIENDAVIIQKFGIKVSYSIKQELSVSVGKFLSNRICGACGELTANTQRATFQAQLDKYRAPDFPRCY